MKIAILGQGKTGTTWMTHLCKGLFNLNEIRPLKSLVPRVFQQFAADFPENSVVKQHYSPMPSVLTGLVENNIHAITMMRDPYDAFVSLFHFVQEHHKHATIYGADNELIGKDLNDPTIITWITDYFSNHLEVSYEWMLSKASTMIRYEDLLKDPIGTLNYLCVRLGTYVPASRIQEVVDDCTPGKLLARINYPAIIRKATSGSGRKELSEAHIAAFRTYGDLIAALGYEVL